MAQLKAVMVLMELSRGGWGLVVQLVPLPVAREPGSTGASAGACGNGVCVQDGLSWDGWASLGVKTGGQGIWCQVFGHGCVSKISHGRQVSSLDMWKMGIDSVGVSSVFSVVTSQKFSALLVHRSLVVSVCHWQWMVGALVSLLLWSESHGKDVTWQAGFRCGQGKEVGVGKGWALVFSTVPSLWCCWCRCCCHRCHGHQGLPSSPLVSLSDCVAVGIHLQNWSFHSIIHSHSFVCPFTETMAIHC